MKAGPVSVYVAIGSNVCPVENVPAALQALWQHGRITGLSSFYATQALERPEQNDYVNGVVRLETTLMAREFKHKVLREIEAELGRTRCDDRFAPRTMDLDLLLYGDALIAEEGLHVPDPDILERAFLVRGLLDIEPRLTLPGDSRGLSDPGPLQRLPAFSQAMHAWWHWAQAQGAE